MNSFCTSQGTKRFFYLLFLPIVLFLSGCPHDKYTLELCVQKDVLHRKLTVEYLDPAISKKEIAALEKLYQQKASRSGERHNIFAFRGEFSGQTPNDVGGQGSVLYYTSSLGSVWAYLETFRGNDDIAQQVENRIEAVNRTVNFFRGWMKSEFSQMENFDKLDSFLNTAARQDLKNFVFYLGMIQEKSSNYFQSTELADMSADSDSATQPTTQPEQSSDTQPASPPEEISVSTPNEKEIIVVRIVQYFLQRNYIPRDLLPVLIDSPSSIFDDAQPEGKRLRRKWILHILEHKAGLAPDSALAVAVTDLLSDKEALTSSLLKYILTTPEYQAFLKAMQIDSSASSELVSTSQPAESKNTILLCFLQYYIKPQLFIRIPVFTNEDALSISLLLSPPTEILSTNGTYDPKTNSLQWKSCIDMRDESCPILPLICYAVWASPEETAQNKRFGKVVLKGETLARYTAWLHSLSAEKTEQWNTFLDTMTPDNAADMILSFRFNDSVAPEVQHESSFLRTLYRVVSGKEPPKMETQPTATENRNDE